MSTRAHSDVLKTADIYVGDQPIELQRKGPAIYDAFAVQADTDISIACDVTQLVQGNQEFRRKATEVLGPLNLIEIKVTGKDHAVLIRDPSVEGSEFQPIALTPSSETEKIADKTQRAYQRFLNQSSHPISRDSFPQSSFYGRSFSSAPFSSDLHDRLQSLERENRELQAEMENLRLRKVLKRTERLLDVAHQQLTASGAENEELTREINDLRCQLKAEQRRHHGDLGEINEALANAATISIALLMGIASLQEENTQLKKEAKELQERNQGLRCKEMIHTKAQELVGATSPANLIDKIKQLRKTLQEKSDENGRLQGQIEEAAAAQDAATTKHKGQIRQQNEALVAAEQKVEEMETAVKQAQSELSGEKSLFQELEGQAEKLRRELGETQRAHAQEKKHLGEAISKLKSGLEETKKTLVALQKAQQELVAKEEELRGVQEASSQRGDFSDEEVRQLESLLSEIESITASNRGLLPRKPVSSIADELKEVEEIQERLPPSQQYRGLPQTVGKIIEALKAARRELSEKAQLVKRKEEELIDLRDLVEREQQSTQVLGLQTKVKELEEELAQNQNQAAGVVEGKMQLIERLRGKLRTERARFEEEHQEVRAEPDGLEKRADQLAFQLERERGKVAETDAENRALADENEQVRQRLRSLEERLGRSAARLQAIELDRDYWQETSSGFEAEQQELREKNLKLEKEADQLAEEVSQYKATNGKLANENERLRAVLSTVFDTESCYTPEDYQQAREQFVQKHKEALAAQIAEIKRIEKQVQTVERLRNTSTSLTPTSI